AAKEIDKRVDANHQKYQIKPNPKTTDEQFVRRVYLDITGTIPTYKQVNVFLSSQSPAKRAKLIDTLLNSEGYASHHFNYCGDIRRLSDELSREVTAAPYNEWLKQALAQNKPYDRLVYEMLTAQGKYWRNPATGYLLRDAGMPVEAMSI